MSQNEVSILLEILDLEYLKPILINRFEKLDDLAAVNLQEIGIQNEQDRNKLRYALDELLQKPDLLEQYDPILSLHDSSQIITRIDNEASLISSSLNLLLNSQNNSNLPIDDATSDIDYSIYRSEIDQIEADVEQLQHNAEVLIEQIQTQFPQIQQEEQTENEGQHRSNKFLKETLFILALSVLTIGFMFYIKRK